MSETVKKTNPKKATEIQQESTDPRQETTLDTRLQQEPTEPRQETTLDTRQKTTTKSNPWKEMRSVRLPRGNKDEARSEYVAVNGKSYQIPRGKTVEVPRPIYEVLMRRNEALDELEDYRDSISKESFPQTEITPE